MLDFIGEKWAKNKDKLKARLANTPQEEYDEYVTLLKIAIEEVLNDEEKKFDTADIETKRFGYYQGDYLFVFHEEDDFYPELWEYYYTTVAYGSCSCCDTLQHITDIDGDYWGLPNEKQLNGYMTLCLHMLQRIKKFDDSED